MKKLLIHSYSLAWIAVDTEPILGIPAETHPEWVTSSITYIYTQPNHLQVCFIGN